MPAVTPAPVVTPTAIATGEFDVEVFMLSSAWQCLSDTPENQKNAYFDEFLSSETMLLDVFSSHPIEFAQGLEEVLQSEVPPTTQYFQTLSDVAIKGWGVYIIVLSKPDHTDRVYVGSATSADYGIISRWYCYDNENGIPRYYNASLKEGFTVVSRGLLCWTPSIPPPGIQPVFRLLFLLLEATFSYIFWAMRTPRGNDYGMAHICPWDRLALEYTGLCSHCCLTEGVIGDFSLSPEQLEELAVKKEERRLYLKKGYAADYHFKQMETNYHAYMALDRARCRTYRAAHREELNTKQNAYFEKCKADKRHHCDACNESSTTAAALRKHKKLQRHADNVAGKYLNNRFTTYNASSHDVTFDDHGILVLGSGVYRIGSSVEFDWCAVNATRSLNALGKKTVMINYNPETYSTDFDVADKLYFEELSYERVMDIYELETASGVVVSVGGQLPQNIALKLQESGKAKVLGTDPEDIDKAEDRHKFSSILDSIGVDQPAWKELTSYEDAKKFANSVGYPVLVRPSYVLSGAAMTVIRGEDELKEKLLAASNVSPDHPVVITQFIDGAQEIDCDAVASNGNVLVHAVSEHVENAGVHSGDATLVLPPVNLDKRIQERVKEIADKVAKAWNITGPFNMQIIKEEVEGSEPNLKVIECNLRASRSFPFVSKVLGTNFIEVATKALVGRDVPEPTDLMSVERNYLATKVPQFSWTRLAGADPYLGVEMSSTGEMACFGKDLVEAYWASAQSQMNFRLPQPGEGLLFGGDVTPGSLHSNSLIQIAKYVHALGYRFLAANKDVKELLEKNTEGISVEVIEFPKDDKRKLREVFEKNDIRGCFNLAKYRASGLFDEDYVMRRNAVDFGVPLFMEPKTAVLFAQCMSEKLPKKEGIPSEVRSWSDFVGGRPL